MSHIPFIDGESEIYIYIYISPLLVGGEGEIYIPMVDSEIHWYPYLSALNPSGLWLKHVQSSCLNMFDA